MKDIRRVQQPRADGPHLHAPHDADGVGEDQRLPRRRGAGEAGRGRAGAGLLRGASPGGSG